MQHLPEVIELANELANEVANELDLALDAHGMSCEVTSDAS